MRRIAALALLAALVVAGPDEDIAAVLAAFKNKNEKVLKALAARDMPEPWWVADELCARGKFDAAEAFANAASRRGLGKLAEYVALQRVTPTDAAFRKRFARASDAFRTGGPIAALAATDGLKTEVDSVSKVMLLNLRAHALVARGRLVEASTGFLKAAEVAERLGWPASAGRALFRAGRAAGEGGDPRRALLAFERLLAVETEHEGRGRAITLRNLSLLCLEAGRFREARGYLERHLKLMEEEGSPAGVAETIVRLCQASMGMADYDAALEHGERALHLLRKQGNQERATGLLVIVGAVHCSRRDPAKARECLESAIVGLRRLGNRRGEASALMYLSAAQSALGNEEKAEDLEASALAIYEAVGDRRALAHSILQYGIVQSSLGNSDKAQASFERTLKLFKEHGAPAEATIPVLDRLSDLYMSVRDIPNALRYAKRTLRQVEALGDQPAVARTLIKIGWLRALSRRYAVASDHFRRSAQIAAELDDAYGRAKALDGVAHVLLLTGDFDRAIGHLAEVLGIYEKLGARENVALILTLVGMNRFMIGQREQGLRDLRRSVREFEELGDEEGRALSLVFCAAAHAETEDWDAALVSVQKGDDILKRIGSPWRFQALEVIGFCYAAMKDYDNARLFLERSLKESGKESSPALGDVLLRTDRPRDAEIHFRQAVAAFERQRHQIQGLSDRQRSALRKQLLSHDPFAGLAEVHFRLDRPQDALRCVERGRGRDTLNLLARSRFDPLAEAERRARIREDKETLGAIEKARSDLAEADRRIGRITYELAAKRSFIKEGSSELEALKEAERSAKDARERALEARARLTRNLVGIVNAATPEDLQTVLETRERLLVYSVSHYGALLLVVPPAGEIRGYRLKWPDGENVTKESLEEAVDLYVQGMVREGRGEKATIEQANLGARLYDALVPESMQAELAKLARVYVVPHGPLHRLPLESLVVNPEKRQYWLDTAPPVAYASSGSVLLTCRRRRDAQIAMNQPYDILAVGDPAFGSELTALPGTRREVESIRKAFGGVGTRNAVLLGEQATKPRLTALASKARYLHLATHQIPDETEHRGYSRLALALPDRVTDKDNGFLSLYELFEHWRDRLSNCELVVLSACETNKGKLQKDDGPYAMPLGFLYAGASAVIGSLWRVEDRSTAELMSTFYRQLESQGGRDKLKAFTDARKMLRKKYPAPYYWAPFIFIGDPR